jgi:hypothetical protein
MWPISTRVNSPLNDDERLLDEIDPAEIKEAAARQRSLRQPGFSQALLVSGAIFWPPVWPQ